MSFFQTTMSVPISPVVGWPDAQTPKALTTAHVCPDFMGMDSTALVCYRSRLVQRWNAVNLVFASDIDECKDPRYKFSCPSHSE